MTYGESTLLLGNIYAPNVDQPDFFMNIFLQLEQFQCDNMILGGDLNVALNAILDYKTTSNRQRHNVKAAKTINSFMKENNWCDIWRVLNDTTFQYTWKRVKPLCMSRLNYFLMPQYCVGIVDDCQIIPGLESDHLFIQLEMKFEEAFRGRGFWKMNNAFLKNKFYLDEVNEMLDLAMNRYDNLTACLKWEMIKIDIIQHAMNFGKRIAREKRLITEVLNKKLRTQQKKLACINLQATNSVPLIEK